MAWRVRPAVRQAHFPNYFDASNQRRATARRQRRGLDVRLSPDSGGIADIAAGPFRAQEATSHVLSEMTEAANWAASRWSSWLLFDAIYSDDVVFGETFPNFSDGFIFR